MLKNLNQRDLYSPSSLISVCPQLGSADEQRCWLRLLFGHCRYELGLPRSMSWLLQAPTPLSIMVRLPVVEPRRCPCNPLGADQGELLQSSPQFCGSEGVLVVLLGPLFLLEKPEAQRRLLHTVWCWLGVQECGQLVVSTLTLLVQSVLVSVVQGHASAHPHVPGFFSGVLFLSSCSLFF